MAALRANKNAHLIGYYATLPAASDALVFIPVATTGLPTDAVLKDADDLAAILAAGAVEQTSMGRKTVTSTTVTVDDVNDRTDIDCADVTWTAPTGDPVAKVLVCYDPDTTTGTDATLVYLGADDFLNAGSPVTPDGVSNVTYQVNASGLFRVG